LPSRTATSTSNLGSDATAEGDGRLGLEDPSFGHEANQQAVDPDGIHRRLAAERSLPADVAITGSLLRP
jgi:hypothetical protein